MADYPEHEKLHAVKERSQAIGEFITWLAQEKGLHLCRYHEGQEHPATHRQMPGSWEPVAGPEPVCDTVLELLHEFFGIDRKLIEAEKDRMLAEVRASGVGE